MNWFKKLARQLGQHGQRTSAVTTRTTPTRLGVERMEDRLTPIVGALSPAQAIDATISSAFDGVVQVNGGSGSLLWTGRHVLTAAHVVDRNLDGVSDSSNVRIQFDTRSGPITVPSSSVTIHNNWNGAVGNGWDFAIVELSALAPVSADRYTIYRDSNESGQVFTVAGYGWGGTGATGSDGIYGVKRFGQNRFDQALAGARLGFDLDSGSFLDNRMGTATPLAAEADTAPGDSGGPSFINWQIAAVTSYGDINTPNVRLFGDRAYNGRVSQVQGWVDSLLNQPDDIVLNLNFQEPGSSGNFVEVWQGPTDLWLKVNGVEDAIPLAEVRSLRIIGTNGNDHILFKDAVLDQAFGVRVDAGSGNDTLQAPNTWNLWDVTGMNSGVLNWDVPFTGVENLWGGSSGDEFRFSPSGFLTGQIRGGFGMPDTINYSAWTTGVSVNLSAGTATAVFGGLFDIENAWGGEGRDTLIGNSMNNALFGNGDIDRLEGGWGEDWLVGGAGNDTLDGGNDGIKDHLYGGTGQDTFVTHYNPFVKGGLTYWFPEIDDTDYDASTDMVVRRYW